MLFFFNVTVNGHASSDTVGAEFVSLAGMQREAVRSLLAIAKDEATEVDRQAFEIVVLDSEGPVYHASLLFESGLDHSNR